MRWRCVNPIRKRSWDYPGNSRPSNQHPWFSKKSWYWNPQFQPFENRVDLYKENPGGPFRDYVDFKIGYGTDSEKIRKFLQKVFDQALKSGAGLDQDTQPSIALKENEDHAARWRISYVLKNPQKLLAARDAINLAAYELQSEAGLSVSTPLTLIMENKN